jgi:polyhydroxybutyrate depolymerase
MARTTAITLAISALLALSSCGKSSRPREPEPSASSAGSLHVVAPGPSSVGSLQSSVDEAASAGLYVPSGGSAQRLPLLIFLHGLGGSGSELREHLNLVAQADARGFAMLTPDGPIDFAGRRYWNASESCCDFDGKKPDHIAELRRSIEAATRHSRVDPARVYLIGFSNGGFLAHRAGCDLAPLLHGIVSIAGAGPGKAEPCEPQAPLNVLQVHGTDDPIVAFKGGYLFADTRRPRHPSADETIGRWAKAEGCAETPSVSGSLDLDPTLVGGETEVVRFDGCRGVRVELWKIAGGVHTSGLSRASVNAILDFIAALEPKPETPLPTLQPPAKPPATRSAPIKKKG